MLHTRRLQQLFDFLFPPSESARVLRSVSEEWFLTLTHEGRAPGGRYLLSYTAPAVQAAIKACKFEQHQRAARLLGSVLGAWLLDSRLSEPVCMLPIPLAPRRLRQRGHNQVRTILQHTKLPDGCTVEDRLLVRTHDTPPQTSLSRSERLTNMKNAFTYNGTRDSLRTYGSILILDDVTTTGATFEAARAALAPHTDIPIICTALAH